MPGRVYVTVRCPSVCPSVCPSMGPQQQTRCCILFGAQQQRRANAGSDMLLANVGSWTQICTLHNLFQPLSSTIHGLRRVCRIHSRLAVCAKIILLLFKSLKFSGVVMKPNDYVLCVTTALVEEVQKSCEASRSLWKCHSRLFIGH